MPQKQQICPPPLQKFLILWRFRATTWKERRLIGWNIKWCHPLGIRSPIFDRFYANGGLQTLIEISNFNYNEFEYLWHHCRTSLTQRLTIGQGIKTDDEPTELCLIVLCVLKLATNWDLMGEIYEKKGPTCNRLFSHAVKTLSPFWL